MAKTNETDKDKILSQVLLDIEKQFGKGTIMKCYYSHPYK